MSVPSIKDKHRNNYVLCSQNTIQNDATITNNDDIQSCDTPKQNLKHQPFQQLIIINNVLFPHSQVKRDYTQKTILTYILIFIICIFPNFDLSSYCVYHNITIYLYFFTIRHGERHWKNVQIQSMPSLNFFTQGKCWFIFRISNTIFY